MAYKNLRQRVITGAILIGVVVALYSAAAYSSNARWLIAFAIFISCGLASTEFANICNTESGTLVRTAVYFTACMIPPVLILFSLIPLNTLDWSRAGVLLDGSELFIVNGGFFLAFLLLLALIITGAQSGLSTARSIAEDAFLGVFHIGFCGALLLCLPFLETGHNVVLWLCIVVFGNDIAAYFTGSKFQGPKLAPAISPGKTISGAAGGVLIGCVLGVSLSFLLPQYSDGRLLAGAVGARSIVDTFFLSLLVVVAAQCGDLAKSYIKRVHGVKDSGTLLPGHGGMLDRIDGLLMATPALYLWLQF